jgi:hypothetical protein
VVEPALLEACIVKEKKSKKEEEKALAVAKKAEEKALALAKKAEEKALAVAKKAEEKALAVAKKSEEKASKVVEKKVKKTKNDDDNRPTPAFVDPPDDTDVVKKIKVEGVTYLKSKKSGIVYNMEQDVIGKWDDVSQKILFNPVDAELEEDECESDSE